MLSHVGLLLTIVTGFSSLAQASSITDISLLTPAGSTETVLGGISNTGQVVGSFYAGSGSCSNGCGFLYSGGVYTSLAVPGALGTFAYGINNSGQIAGTYITGYVTRTRHCFNYGRLRVFGQRWRLLYD